MSLLKNLNKTQQKDWFKERRKYSPEKKIFNLRVIAPLFSFHLRIKSGISNFELHHITIQQSEALYYTRCIII